MIVDLVSVLGRLPGTPSEIARSLYSRDHGNQHPDRNDPDYNRLKRAVGGALKELVARGVASRGDIEWDPESKTYRVEYWPRRNNGTH